MPKIFVIGGSAGSIDALKIILAGLPPDFPAALLIVTHIGSHESKLPQLLERVSALPVRHARQGEPILAGQVLLAPPDLHLGVVRNADRLFAQLSRGPKENHSRPAIDPLFRSAAVACGADAVAVVLSGFLDDGTVGLQAVKARGGVAVVQDPAQAEAPDMPASAIRHGAVDFVLGVEAIAPLLVKLANGAVRTPHAGTERIAPELPEWIAIEDRVFNKGAGMEELDKIGTRVALTCPECGGAIWQIHDAQPLRYRCHTGHAFTANVLATLQRSELEEALWSAVRALHEQEQLFRQLHRAAQGRRAGAPDAAGLPGEYLAKAEQAAGHAQLLRDLIASRMSVAPG